MRHRDNNVILCLHVVKNCREGILKILSEGNLFWVKMTTSQ